MADSADITFGFDPNPIIVGTDTATKAITNMTDNIEKVPGLVNATFSNISQESKKAEVSAKGFGGRIKMVVELLKQKINPFGRIKKGLSEVSNQANDVGKDMTAMGQDAQKAGGLANMSFSGLLGRLALVGSAIAGIRAGLNKIPEIGQAFSIAGDIFLRNLLNPLRQELLPLLNAMLKWVTDHRALFVKMGSVIAQIFRLILGLAKAFFEILSKIGKSIKNTLTGVFGDITKGITKTINLVITKIAFMALFITTILEPVFETIGKLVGFIATGIVGLFEGIGKGATGIFKVFNELTKSFKELFDVILGGTERASGFRKFMNDIGEIIGKVLITSLKSVVAGIKLVIRFVKSFISGLMEISGIKEAWKAFKNAALGLFDALQGQTKFVSKVMGPVFSFLGKVIGKTFGFILKIVLKVFTFLIKSFSWIIKNVPKVVNLIGKGLGGAFNILKSAVNAIGSALSFIGKKIVQAFDGVVNLGMAIGGFMSKKVSQFFTFVVGLGNAIKNFFIGVKDTILKIMGRVFRWIKDQFNKVGKFIGKAFQGVKGFFGFGKKSDIGANLGFGIGEKKDSRSNLTTAITGATNKTTTNNTNVKFGDIKIQMGANGNPKDAARQFLDEVNKGMDRRRKILDDKERIGE